MEAVTYSNAAVVEFSKKNFVNVEISIDDNPPEARQFGVEGIPVTYLVSPEGKSLGSWRGFVPPDPYVKNLKKAVTAHRRLKDVEPRLKANPSDAVLNAEAGRLYADLNDARSSTAAFKRAAEYTDAARGKAELYSKALDQATTLDGAGKEIRDLAGRIDGLDPKGEFGFKDNAVAARAILATREQEFEASIKLFETVVNSWPKGDKTPLSLYWLGWLYHEIRKDHDKGIKTLQRLIKEFPNSDSAGDARHMIEHIKEHAGK